MFATNTDLQKYAPEVFDQGVTDWTTELTDGQKDIENMIQFRWYNKYNDRLQWDAGKLTAAQWTKSTVYHSLANYILPRLSTFRPEGDPFREQITFFKERFAEEFDIQFGLGIEYDTDGSGTVDQAAEVTQWSQDRLYR